jgi:glycosyltransferase involved in cell wall biosynthesis
MSSTPANMLPQLSVLIPIYNAEQHLAKCLDSILNQTQQSMEIICINDGSNDNSVNIIEQKAKKDPRVVLLNKKNSGYGNTLNLGLMSARSKYIGIIEADDFADKTMYQNLLTIALKHDADIVKSDFFEYADNKSHKANIIPTSDANRLIIPCNNFDIFRAQPSIWSGIYSRAFLKKNNIFFTNSVGASFQDTAFNLKTLATSDKVWLIEEAFMHYRRDNNKSSIHSSDKIYAVCNEYNAFERYMKNYPDRMTKIVKPLQSIRFETYSWNLSRLSGHSQLQFYRHMHKKFVSLYRQGLICYDNFSHEDIPLLKLLLDGNQNFIHLSIEARSLKYINR